MTPNDEMTPNADRERYRRAARDVYRRLGAGDFAQAGDFVEAVHEAAHAVVALAVGLPVGHAALSNSGCGCSDDGQSPKANPHVSHAPLDPTTWYILRDWSAHGRYRFRLPGQVRPPGREARPTPAPGDAPGDRDRDRDRGGATYKWWLGGDQVVLGEAEAHVAVLFAPRLALAKFGIVPAIIQVSCESDDARLAALRQVLTFRGGKALIARGRHRARAILRDKWEQLMTVTGALIEHRILPGATLQTLCPGVIPDPPPPWWFIHLDDDDWNVMA